MGERQHLWMLIPKPCLGEDRGRAHSAVRFPVSCLMIEL